MPGIHFCFVDDGSTDTTLVTLQEAALRCTNFTVLHLAQNNGKGEAVRQGMLYGLHQSGFEVFGYWDADLAAPLRELKDMQNSLRANKNLKVVAGSRYMAPSEGIKRSLLRRRLGRIFASLSAMYTRLPIKDSQCGSKIFSRQAVETAFKQGFESRWVFDVEVLRRINRKHGSDSIAEHPLRSWEERSGGSLRAKHYWKIPLELLRLSLRREY